MDSTKVLESLTGDLKVFAKGRIASVDPFISAPTRLVNRDDVNETHVGIGEYGDNADTVLSSTVPYYTDQRYRVRIFIKASAGKGNEKALNGIILAIKDTVIEWLKQLNHDRDIYSLSNQELLTASYTGTIGEAVFTDSYMSLDLGFTSKRKINQ